MHDFFYLRAFLCDYPDMQLCPSVSDGILIKGDLRFTACSGNTPQISDSYSLEILLPAGFPLALPVVTETGGRIPRDCKYHVNTDGSICLGSRLRLFQIINKYPTISGFVENCIIPYLYAISIYMSSGSGFVFGELKHGYDGLIQDYSEILGTASPDKTVSALQSLSMKKRIANKLPCPCMCGNRLGKCKFNIKIRQLRSILSRSWYKNEAQQLQKWLSQNRKISSTNKIFL